MKVLSDHLSSPFIFINKGPDNQKSEKILKIRLSSNKKPGSQVLEYYRKKGGTWTPKRDRTSCEFWGHTNIQSITTLKFMRLILTESLIYMHAHYQMAFRFIVI